MSSPSLLRSFYQLFRLFQPTLFEVALLECMLYNVQGSLSTSGEGLLASVGMISPLFSCSVARLCVWTSSWNKQLSSATIFTLCTKVVSGLAVTCTHERQKIQMNQQALLVSPIESQC